MRVRMRERDMEKEKFSVEGASDTQKWMHNKSLKRIAGKRTSSCRTTRKVHPGNHTFLGQHFHVRTENVSMKILRKNFKFWSLEWLWCINSLISTKPLKWTKVKFSRKYFDWKFSIWTVRTRKFRPRKSVVVCSSCLSASFAEMSTTNNRFLSQSYLLLWKLILFNFNSVSLNRWWIENENQNWKHKRERQLWENINVCSKWTVNHSGNSP